MGEILTKASKKALSGGLAGMAAQAINVLALMWMRTIMNYQYRYGGTLSETVKKLWAEGGVPRFYRGLAPGLIQAPVSRFGDTAANDGALAALEHTTMPTFAKTMCASAAAAGFRVFLMPIDAWKTTKQVEGKDGLKRLIESPESPYIRCCGFLYVRFGLPHDQLLGWLGEYLIDDEEFKPSPDSDYKTTIGEYVEGLMNQDKYYTD